MADMLTIAGSRATANGKLSSYRRVLGLVILLELVIIGAALISPIWACDLLGLPLTVDTANWPRVAASVLLATLIFQIPGWLDPILYRWLNTVGIASRFLLAVAFVIFGGGFVWLALFEAACALLLMIKYQGLIEAEIMTRP